MDDLHRHIAVIVGVRALAHVQGLAAVPARDPAQGLVHAVVAAVADVDPTAGLGPARTARALEARVLPRRRVEVATAARANLVPSPSNFGFCKCWCLEVRSEAAGKCMVWRCWSGWCGVVRCSPDAGSRAQVLEPANPPHLHLGDTTNSKQT